MKDNSTFDKWFVKNKGKYSYIVLYGLIFGGRFGESPQLIKKFKFSEQDGKLIIYFKDTESLIVEDPEGIVVKDRNTLIINNADTVIFGWHYYGKIQSIETWCQESYSKQIDGSIYVQRTGILNPGNKIIRSNDPAVRIIV